MGSRRAVAGDMLTPVTRRARFEVRWRDFSSGAPAHLPSVGRCATSYCVFGFLPDLRGLFRSLMAGQVPLAMGMDPVTQ